MPSEKRNEEQKLKGQPKNETENATSSSSRTSLELGEDPLTMPSTTRECLLCCENVPEESFRKLINCGHCYCGKCFLKHITICIRENRIEMPCPGCGDDMHPDDVTCFIRQNSILMTKYEEFSIRRALVKDRDARWCPAPDCGFAVIVPKGEKCPRIRCIRPKCGTSFCYLCKKEWHPGKQCADMIAMDPNYVPEVVDLRPCPNCKSLIMKADDGSCNHMHCTMCGTQFCWLCLREITDLHFMSPTGCTFWGRKTWSAKRKLAWQIGSLVGSPLVIAAVAVVSAPLIVGLVPYSVGKKVYKKMKDESKAKRMVSTAAAVTGTAIVSPAIAGAAVVFGVPFAIGFTYTMVPKAIVNDAIDYVKKKRKRSPEGSDVTRPLLFPLPSVPRRTSPPPEFRELESFNADGSAPGTSSGI